MKWFWGVEHGWRIRLTNSPLSMKHVPRECGNYSIQFNSIYSHSIDPDTGRHHRIWNKSNVKQIQYMQYNTVQYKRI
jgi:hypothetical protein